MEKHTIRLRGVLADGSFAKTQQADQVVAFVNDKRSISIKRLATNKRLEVRTFRGSYLLYDYLGNSHYRGYLGMFETEVRVKKVVAHLVYKA